MLQSLLFIASYHACSSLCVAACLTVCYWLPHPRIVCCSLSQAVQLVSYLLQHTLQFPICCCMLYRLLFVVACHAVCHMFYSSLFVAACHTISYLSPVLCIWLFISAQSSIIWGKLGAVNCLTSSSTNNNKGLSDKVHCHKK